MKWRYHLALGLECHGRYCDLVLGEVADYAGAGTKVDVKLLCGCPELKVRPNPRGRQFDKVVVWISEIEASSSPLPSLALVGMIAILQACSEK